MNTALKCVDAHPRVKVGRHTKDDRIDAATIQHRHIVLVERNGVLRLDRPPFRWLSVADSAEIHVGDHTVGDQFGVHRPLHAEAHDAQPRPFWHWRLLTFGVGVAALGATPATLGSIQEHASLKPEMLTWAQ